MLRLIAMRLLQLPAILAVLFVATFLLVWAIPGNPLEEGEGRRPPPEIVAAMQRQYNLHSPWAFTRSYVTSVLFEGDLGPSLQYRDQRVNDIIAVSLPISATLGGVALAMALLIGLVTGMIGALRPGSVLDGASLTVALVGVSLPSFVTGSILLAVLAGVVHWAPLGPWDWPGWAIHEPSWWVRLAAALDHIWLPALALSLGPAAYIARLIRLGLADVLSSDFIRTARAKGLPYHRVVYRHAMKVAFLPVLSFLGPAAAYTLTGSFVIEKVFAIPGMGEYFVNAVRNEDQFLVLGVVMTFATMLVLFNLLVDIAYAWVDPRIELS